MSKKECELCSNPARMFCESDEASLCWDCDQKVHAANFLVAKHSRTLLCHVCYSLTPWKAAGEKLGSTVSVCQACADDGKNRGTSCSRYENEDGYDSNSQDSESDDGEYSSDTVDFSEDEEEDGENQVVPWSISGSNSPTHATVASSSGSEENVSFSSSKITRDIVFESEDEDGCCSSQNLDSRLGESDENYHSSPLSLLRPSKMRRRSSDSSLSPSEPAAGEDARVAVPPSGTAAIIEKLRRFEQKIVTEEGDPSAMILGLCKLTRD